MQLKLKSSDSISYTDSNHFEPRLKLSSIISILMNENSGRSFQIINSKKILETHECKKHMKLTKSKNLEMIEFRVARKFLSC